MARPIDTGMRPGEAFALRWSDLRGSTITVRQAVSLYGCRHTHATILLGELKVPLKVVAERLGNSPDILMKHYHHILPGMQSSAIAEYGALLQKAKEA